MSVEKKNYHKEIRLQFILLHFRVANCSSLLCIYENKIPVTRQRHRDVLMLIYVGKRVIFFYTHQVVTFLGEKKSSLREFRKLTR